MCDDAGAFYALDNVRRIMQSHCASEGELTDCCVSFHVRWVSFHMSGFFFIVVVLCFFLFILTLVLKALMN